MHFRVYTLFAVAASLFFLGTNGFQLSMMAKDSSNQQIQRREMLTKSVSLGLGLGVLTGLTSERKIAFAEEGVAPAKTTIEMPPTPKSFNLNKVYYDDAKQMVSHMKYATFMDRGTPEFEVIAKGVKDEMTEFVSYYRRFNNVAGKPSFSNLYTAINVLAGHYTSYGTKFPVPEKRRKRLLQEYNEIEKNIRKSR